MILVRLISILLLCNSKNIIDLNLSWANREIFLYVSLFYSFFILPLCLISLIFGIYYYKNYKFYNNYFHFLYIFRLLLYALGAFGACNNIFINNLGFAWLAVLSMQPFVEYIYIFLHRVGCDMSSPMFTYPLRFACP